jgi:membrane protease YdiL (CAAX protease family)
LKSQDKNIIVNARPKPDRPLILFFIIAYLIGWGFIPLLSTIAQRSGIADWQTLSQMAEALDFKGVDLPAAGWVIYIITRIQDFSFSIAGVIMIGVVAGKEGLKDLGKRLIRWQVNWRWYIFAFLPFGLYLLATLFSGNLGSFQFSGKTLSTILISAEAGFLVYLFLRGPMGEELGLRGFALPRLQTTRSPFSASLIIGVLWAAWHIPVLIGRDVISTIAFILLAFLLSFTFTYLFNMSNGSLIPVLLFHAAQNSEEIFEVLFPSLVGTDWELISSLALLLIGLIVAIVMWRQKDKKELR